jgi:hypothetical protein
MQSEGGRSLKVRVRLLDHPSLWCWDLLEAVTSRLVESSWEHRWEAFASSDEARRAGLIRLTELMCLARDTSGGGVTAAAAIRKGAVPVGRGTGRAGVRDGDDRLRPSAPCAPPAKGDAA